VPLPTTDAGRDLGDANVTMTTAPIGTSMVGVIHSLGIDGANLAADLVR
jgi:hypothetical protein